MWSAFNALPSAASPASASPLAIVSSDFSPVLGRSHCISAARHEAAARQPPGPLQCLSNDRPHLFVLSCK